MEINTFDTQEAFIQAAVEQIQSVIRARTGKQTRIALSGGSTPAAVFRALGADRLLHDEHVTFYQVDERYVPADDPRSNHRLITDNLLIPAHLDSSRFVAFDTSLPIQNAVDTYGLEIKALGSPTFHLTLLGMGPDGHTASLFPGSDALFESSELTAHTTTREFAVLDRLTLTFPAILRSERLLLLMSGRTKGEIIKRFRDATAQEFQSLPATKLKSHPTFTLLYADI